MAASSRAQVLRLYRALLRESQRFSSYNYRNNAVLQNSPIEILSSSGPTTLPSKKFEYAKALCPAATYAIRRIRDAFRENKTIEDSEKIEELLNKAKANLEVIQRQVTIGQLYSTEKLVIESPGNT